MKTRSGSKASLLTACAAATLAAAAALAAMAAPQQMMALPSTVAPFGKSVKVLGAPKPSDVVRLSIALKLRDPAGLSASNQAGRVMPWAELEARHLPSAADYDQLLNFLSDAGLTIVKKSPTRLSIDVSGTVPTVSRALDCGAVEAYVADARDEFVMDHLSSFDGKRIVSAEKSDVKLDTEKPHALSEDESKNLAGFIKETLGARVGEVRVSHRLTGSPAVVVDKDSHMTTSMRRIMKMMQQREGGSELGSLDSKPDLEINPDHAMMVRLEKLRHSDSGLAAQIAEQVFDNALVAAGLLEDPRIMLNRMNTLLEKLLER